MCGFFNLFGTGSVHVPKHGVVVCSDHVGTVEHGQRQTVSAPNQRTGHTQRGTNVLRRRATGKRLADEVVYPLRRRCLT